MDCAHLGSFHFISFGFMQAKPDSYVGDVECAASPSIRVMTFISKISGKVLKHSLTHCHIDSFESLQQPHCFT
jgi:hypothetical protein